MPDLPPLGAVPAVPVFKPRPAAIAAEPTGGAGRAQADAKPAPPPPTVQPPPIAVDVERGAEGVFVYTLRDPVTDTVLAVIPRDAMRFDRVGRRLDQRA